MIEAPVSLLNYFATDLVLATNHGFAADKPVDFREAEYIIEVSAKKTEAPDIATRHWQVSLEVRHQPGAETNFPYSYRVVLVGMFSVHPLVKAEDEERMVRIQGASVLYGMTREIVRVLTGRGPYRPVIIPTVSFYEQKPVTPTDAPAVTAIAPTAQPIEKPATPPKTRRVAHTKSKK